MRPCCLTGMRGAAIRPVRMLCRVRGAAVADGLDSTTQVNGTTAMQTAAEMIIRRSLIVAPLRDLVRDDRIASAQDGSDGHRLALLRAHRATRDAVRLRTWSQ